MSTLPFPRVFTFHYYGDGQLRYEVRVRCEGRRVVDVEPIGWEPAPRVWKFLGEAAVEKHLDWWDEMVEQTPSARKAADEEADRRSDIRDEYRFY